MAPAPKTRAPKGLVVTTTDSSEAAAPENLLVDITENETLSPAQFQRTRTGGGPDIDSASPRAAHAHLTRRHSSTANSENGQVQKRAFTPEMREHLKHLGPANAASKPKHTRMKTITMKPGRSNSQTLDINGTSSARRVSEPLNYQPDKTSPSAADALIPPAGKQAKDGVQLLQSVYGSMDRTPPKSSQSNKAVAAGQEGDLPEPETSPAKHTASTPADDKENHRTPRSTAPDPATSASGPGPNPPQSRASVDSSSSRSTLGSLPGRRARSGSPSVNRGPARSGSITEHYIDAGGVRKIVLETNSSGSSEETGKHGLDGARDSRSASRSSRRKDGTSESTLTPETAGGASRNGGKKKRRRKKGKSGKGGGASEGGSTEAGESQPLLRWT
jgi:metal transporter CNNM